MKNIYILLTRSDTIVSRAILFCTGADYTHASLAYDGELNSLSSFARRDPRFALPAGLVRENICEGFAALHDGIPGMLLSRTGRDEAHRRRGPVVLPYAPRLTAAFAPTEIPLMIRATVRGWLKHAE